MDQIVLYAKANSALSKERQEEIKSCLSDYFCNLTNLSNNEFRVLTREGSLEVWLIGTGSAVALWLLKQIGSWAVKQILNERAGNLLGGKDVSVNPPAVNHNGKKNIEKQKSHNFVKGIIELGEECGLDVITVGVYLRHREKEPVGRILQIEQISGKKFGNILEFDNREDFERFAKLEDIKDHM